MSLENVAQENYRLRRVIGDLVAFANVPAAWIGGGPQQIAESIVDLLKAALRLDGAYLQLNCGDEKFVQASRASDCPAFAEWLKSQENAWMAAAPKQQGMEISSGGRALYVLISPIGINAEAGFVATAAYRPDYPTETEALLLSVAANQALISFRTFVLLSEGRRNEEMIVALTEEIDQASMFEEIVGSSPAIQGTLSRVAKVAPTDTTVLILGETGTGKELIARAIHKLSPRSHHPIVSVNCAATPPSLIASELFGHEKGAFTGALQRRLGRFELAKGGTILLDEIGELPPETQIALLRVLQERQFERVGGTQVLMADARVIASTNRDLQAAVAAGTFRMDLFYRLNVFPIEVPPLRERSEDIPTLVEYFVQRYARKLGKRITNVSEQTMELFQTYHWPGNIRQLQNVIERSVILCDGEVFRVDESWLLSRSLHGSVSPILLSERLQNQEREIIEEVLAKTRGRIAGPSGAAAMLGIPPSTLDSRIKSLMIDKNRFKVESNYPPPASHENSGNPQKQ
jgi:transcriptional regulator with GAF, ATPase, and Fis domain